MFTLPDYPVSNIIFTLNGRTMETGRIGGAHETVAKHAQQIIDSQFPGGVVTLVQHF